MYGVFLMFDFLCPNYLMIIVFHFIPQKKQHSPITMSLFDLFRAEQQSKTQDDGKYKVTAKSHSRSPSLSPDSQTNDDEVDAHRSEILDMLLQPAPKVATDTGFLQPEQRGFSFEGQTLPTKDELSDMCSSILYSESRFFLETLLEEQRLMDENDGSSGGPLSVILWLIFEFTTDESEQVDWNLSRKHRNGGYVTVKKINAVPLEDFAVTSNAKSIMILHEEACRLREAEPPNYWDSHPSPFVCWYVVESSTAGNVPLLSQVTLVKEDKDTSELPKEKTEQINSESELLSENVDLPATPTKHEYENLYRIDESPINSNQQELTNRGISPSVEVITQDIEEPARHTMTVAQPRVFEEYHLAASTQPAHLMQPINFETSSNEDLHSPHSLGTTLVGAHTTPPTPSELPLFAPPFQTHEAGAENNTVSNTSTVPVGIESTVDLKIKISELESQVANQASTIRDLEETIKKLQIEAQSALIAKPVEHNTPVENDALASKPAIAAEIHTKRLNRTSTGISTPQVDHKPLLQPSIIASANRGHLTPARETVTSRQQSTPHGGPYIHPENPSTAVRRKSLSESQPGNPMASSLLYNSSYYKSLKPAAENRQTIHSVKIIESVTRSKSDSLMMLLKAMEAKHSKQT